MTRSFSAGDRDCAEWALRSGTQEIQPAPHRDIDRIQDFEIFGSVGHGHGGRLQIRVTGISHGKEIGQRLIGVVITGNQATPPGRGGSITPAGYQTVSRAELLTTLQMAVQADRFEVDRPRCREWEALRRELSILRLEGGFSKGKKSQDDLAFALALAIWWGMRL